MKSATRFLLLSGVALLSTVVATTSHADVIELKTGHKVEGDVLKQQAEFLEESLAGIKQRLTELEKAPAGN